MQTRTLEFTTGASSAVRTRDKIALWLACFGTLRWEDQANLVLSGVLAAGLLVLLSPILLAVELSQGVSWLLRKFETQK